MQTLIFKNQDQMPALGLGTWKSSSGEVYEAIREAIRIGYRHIDCASAYGNEAEIGQAFQDAFEAGEVKREDLWVTSKLWNAAHRASEVKPALEKTLADLKFDYLDLYLIHWPIAIKANVGFPQKADDYLSLEEVPIIETWRAMEACVEAGLSKHIGVSNFSIKKLEDLRNEAQIQPEVNQIELHPLLAQNKMLAYCQTHDIFLTAYSPLGSKDRPARLVSEDAPTLLENPILAEIAQEHQCTSAQVLIAWAIQRGTSVIPKIYQPSAAKTKF